jgi:hypothetical protein
MGGCAATLRGVAMLCGLRSLLLRVGLAVLETMRDALNRLCTLTQGSNHRPWNPFTQTSGYNMHMNAHSLESQTWAEHEASLSRAEQ